MEHLEPTGRPDEHHPMPLDAHIARLKHDHAEQLTERAALTAALEREVLGQRVEATLRAVQLVSEQGLPGQAVDVFTASGDDAVGGRVLESVYGRLGIRGARLEASTEALLNERDEQIGTIYHILGGTVGISELQIDETMQHGQYRTLRVHRSLATPDHPPAAQQS